MKPVHVAGKRKRAVAKATIKPGNGILKINNILIGNYHPKLARMRIMEPIQLAGDASAKVDIIVRVSGGGIMSQAEAIRLSIARALVENSKGEGLKEAFLAYDRHLLVADTRRKEMRKPNDSKARAARQKSYR